MENAYFFSDETGLHSGGRYFLVAGVALTHYRKWIVDDLHHAEHVSNKGKQDWKGTKIVQQRVRYIEEASAIRNLQGSIFFAGYENTTGKNYWAHTVEALTLAIGRYGHDRHCIIRHQGLNFRSREKLKESLARCEHSFEIQSGSEKRAEIRLADAIAGYIGLLRFNPHSQTASYYPPLPEWFVNLKNEAPLPG